ncbi:MAG: PAS domain S-box protein [Desulfobacteraceae bacterium]|nr:PAS domain S-box protein [Desulfobacteraceae bacterium]
MATTPSGGKTSKRKTPDHNTPNTACSIEDKYRAAFEHTAAATFIFDEDTTITLANAKVTELTGYSAAEIAGKLKWIDLVAPGDAERIRLYHMPGTDPGVGSPTEYELKIYDKSGEIRDVLAHVARIPDTGSTIASWVDVTERHKNEAERIRLATAAEQSYESYTITDSHGRIQYVNTAFEQMTGLSREQVVGKRIEKIFSGQKDADIFSIMRFSVASGEVWSGRITNRDTEGKVYQTETRISPIRDAAGKILHFLSIKRDISTEVQLEEQLRQAQRLQAIGTLAGGIAHDFNNILAGIMGYTEMSLAEAPKDSDLHRKLKRVMEGCYRARDLVHQILAFSRQNKQERKPVQIELIVEEALKLLRSTLPASIKILKKIETDHSVVLADPSRIHQVLMNLCTNAFHAMKSGPGELYIQLGDIRIQEDKIPSGLDLAPGTYVKLVV